jgi:tetratricopeptide (TPR) repeat protein
MKPGKGGAKLAPMKRMTEPTIDDVNALVALYNHRRYTEAETNLRALLDEYPDFGFGWKLLGGILQRQGKDALPTLQKAVKLNPDDAVAHLNLGDALKNLGRFDQAAASYQRAIQLDPDYAEAYCNLGTAFRRLGRLDDAVANYRNSIALKPDFALAYYNLGNVLKELVQLDAAVSSYRSAVEIRPEFFEAHFNLSAALKDLQQFDSALESNRRALQIKPDFAEGHNNLGDILKELGQFEDALASYQKATELKPDYVEAHKNMGVVLQRCEQFDAAEASFRKALEFDARYIEALLGIGHLYVVKGESKEAEASIKRILEIYPDNLDARLMLAGLKKARVDDENLAALLTTKEAVINGHSNLSNQKVTQLNFVLGKCFDDVGDHDKAFSYFIEGCKLKRATIEYDSTRATQHFSAIKQIFNRATIERLKGGGHPSDLPIFVLGMPRSGTTLTEQIIAGHPDVYGAGELPDLNMIAQRRVKGSNSSFPKNIAYIDQASLATWAADYVAGLQRRAPDSRHITDKMPANFFFIGLIHLMLPNAKIIHVNRNPVDTCLSCFMQLFSGGNEQTYDLAELGRYYVDYVRLMDHWRDVLPAGSFLDVRYEDIVTDLESQARHIIDFCDMQWNDACIDFHKHHRPVNTASMTQVRQPIYKSSVERWRKYERFLGPLLDELGDLKPNQHNIQG